jgi:GDPmannose 4,6-dehydratase
MEVDRLVGDPSKAACKLGWKATRRFENMVAEMMDSDLVKVREEQSLVNRHK